MIRWLSLPGFGLTGLPLEKHYNRRRAMGYDCPDRNRGNHMGGKVTSAAMKATPKKAAKKSPTKTHATPASVPAFLAAVEKDARRAEAETLLKVYEKVTGWKPKMWGPTIIGYGSYTYTYDSGHSGNAPVVGFSPRGAALSIYSGMSADQPECQAILKTLAKHKTAKACIYINKLADVDIAAFEKLIRAGVANMKKTAKKNGWPLSGN